MKAEPSTATRTVETSVRIDDVAPERVIEAFVRHDDLASWWRVTRSLVEPVPGGLWCVTWDEHGEHGTHHSWCGVVYERAARRLVIAPLVQNEPVRPLFGPLTLEIFAAPVTGGASLTVRHHGYQRGEDWDWLHDAVVTGWADVLVDLKAWFDHSAPPSR